MWVKREIVTATTPAGSGDVTVYSSVIRGVLMSIVYTKTDYDGGVDFAITGETTGQKIWVKDNVDASITMGLMLPAYNNTGTAITNQGTPIGIPNERIKIAITNAGNAHTGTFAIIWS